jgi:hypothetical protein
VKLNWPCQLPSDLKALYSVSNGWRLEWEIEGQHAANPRSQSIKSLAPPISGRLCISSLPDLVRVELGGCAPESDDEELTHAVRRAPGRAFFVLNNAPHSECDEGEALVALVYPHKHVQHSHPGEVESRSIRGDAPCVMLRDFAGDWHYLAPDVTSYIRLQFAHLGVRHWQFHRVKGIGLPPDTKVNDRFYPGLWV